MDRRTVSIIAGGWSLTELGDPGRARIPGFKIGVNDAMILAKCDAGVTMDRLWIEHRIDRARQSVQTLWVRRTAMVNVREEPRVVRRFECDHETAVLSDTPGWLNGKNSGHCALNLAYKMRPQTIVLWGFDMSRAPDGEAYWYPAYAWSKPNGTPGAHYANWARETAEAAETCRRAGIKVLNASMRSAVDGIEKVSPWSLLT